MGLDMYVEVEKYVGGWEHESDDNKASYKAVLEAVGMETSPCSSSPSLNVSVTAAYWRKANHIHNWFVENVQDGVDECQRSYVTTEQIQELVSICEQIMKTVVMTGGQVRNGQQLASVADGGTGEWEDIMEDGQVIVNREEVAALLPTRSGCFFGSTDYDERFADDIKVTIKQLKPLLSPDYDGCSFYYRSSW